LFDHWARFRGSFRSAAVRRHGVLCRYLAGCEFSYQGTKNAKKDPDILETDTLLPEKKSIVFKDVRVLNNHFDI
jgi:hypothetical protein